jgi:CubicO group peptidase (beta-lactamase class C family)
VQPWVTRLLKAHSLFEPDEIAWNFTHMTTIFPSVRVEPAPADGQWDLPKGAALTLPTQFERNGHVYSTDAFLDDTGLTGLLVLQDGKRVFESYRQGHEATAVHISWSLAKSMISAMIGIAIEEGRIKDVADPVERYAPTLKGTAYEGVALRDVLHMSSGVYFNENYDDSGSDVVQLARRAAFSGSFNEYAGALVRDIAPGTLRRYSSYDTQVLAMVLQGATGLSVREWMQHKLWQPMGAEQAGFWIVDGQGMEMGFGGFNASLRDYGRFGQLYLNRGAREGVQVVPAQWVDASLTMNAPHLTPGVSRFSDSALGYGYQWWIPDDPARDYMGIGVYNQFIFVSPSTGTVIVKNSANHKYTSDDYELTMQHVAFFRAVAQAAGALGKEQSP